MTTEMLPSSAQRVQTFLSRSRCYALTKGCSLPEHEVGAALFADISGFTPLTESLGRHLGPRRGAETLTAVINQVFEVLIAQIHRYGGDVLGFAGDAMLCWFADLPAAQSGEEQGSKRALSAAWAMQQEMARFQAVPTPDGKTHTLTMKAGLAGGPARRFTTGVPEYGRFDMLTGATLTRVAEAEHHAAQGEIVVGAELAPLLGDAAEWGPDRDAFLPLLALHRPAEATAVEELPPLPLELETLRPYFPPTLFDWLANTGEEFLGELRPVVSAFIRFEGLDYEGDPQVGEKLDRYVALVQGTAARFGGSLIRLEYGDKGSVAHVVFGAPLAHEDDEARAIGWVLDLQGAVRTLPFISAQYIGITRGQVYAGALGATTRRGYTLMGDEVNASARLMQACQPGQVLVSQRIMQATQKRFAFHQFPGFQVKGKYEPIPVATPVAPLPALQQQAPVGPLIGREAEMARLEALLDQLFAGGSAVLRLSGPEGVGKSRLVADVVQRAMQRGARVLAGNGQGVGQNIPYLPFQEMLRSLLGLQSAWPPQQQAMQIQMMLQWMHPEWLPRVPLLGDLLGLEIADTPMTAAFDARMRRESLFALLGDLLARMASQQPMLLLFEDGHWFDEASTALVEALARRLVNDPVLVIVTHRPPLDLEHPLLAGLDGLASYASLDLTELTPDAAGTLVTARLGGELPAELLAAVQERAQGNPLFVEELAATLRESGRLQQVAGRWTLVGVESKDLVLPDSIRSVALARVDALDEESKFTLKVASVVGQVFAPRIVGDVHPAHLPAQALGEHLATLERRDLILEEEPRQSYRFKHNATHEVAYDVLLYAQRQALHRAIAGWYETNRPETLSAAYPMLAYHYHEAEEPEQERRYTRLAGEQAAARFANADALRYIDRALELTPADNRAARYDLLLVREKVYDLQGDREAQVQDLDTLQALVDELGEAGCRVEVALRRGRYAELTGDYPAAIAAAQAAIQLAASSGDVAGETVGQLQWGRALWRQGDYQEALIPLENVLVQARANKLIHLEADGLLNLGIVDYYTGDYSQARTRLEQARAIYQNAGDRVYENRALNTLGTVLNQAGQAAAAQVCFEQALQNYREIGDRWGECIVLGNLGMALEFQVKLAEAQAVYEQALRISREIDDPQSTSQILNNLGFVALNQVDYPGAQSYFEQALSTNRELGNRRNEGSILSNLALLAYLQDDDLLARSYAEQALEIAQEVGDRSIQGEALTHLGNTLARQGEREVASKSLRQAVVIRREIGEQNMVMESLAGLARIHLTGGDPIQALALVQEILTHLESQSLDGAYEPLRIHLTCYQVLRESADPQAGMVLARAYRLLQERAARIDDEALRRSFLENVAAHREIIAALERDPEAAALLAAQEPAGQAEEAAPTEPETAVEVPLVPVAPAGPAAGPAVPLAEPAAAPPLAPTVPAAPEADPGAAKRENGKKHKDPGAAKKKKGKKHKGEGQGRKGTRGKEKREDKKKQKKTGKNQDRRRKRAPDEAKEQAAGSEKQERDQVGGKKHRRKEGGKKRKKQERGKGRGEKQEVGNLPGGKMV